MSHEKREEFRHDQPLHVTVRLRAGLPNLRYHQEHEVLKQAMAEASRGEGFRVIEYSIQSNHLHFVAESVGRRELARGMIGLEVRVARALNKLWKRVGQVFSDRFHARALKTPSEVRIALIYVLNNARKHGAWRAHVPDEYSSGPAFDGWADLAESKPGFLARARTWLLAFGWRRHGRIDPRAAPA